MQAYNTQNIVECGPEKHSFIGSSWFWNVLVCLAKCDVLFCLLFMFRHFDGSLKIVISGVDFYDSDDYMC